MLVIWTGKPCLNSLTEGTAAAVVHRRGPAAREARIKAQRSGRRGGTCGPTVAGRNMKIGAFIASTARRVPTTVSRYAAQ
jgi:hypothetical protein